MNNHVMENFIRLIIFPLIAVLPLFSKASGQTGTAGVSLNPSTEESGENIMAREMFFHMRRAGGPDKLIPPSGYEAALLQSKRVQKDRNLLTSSTAATNWVSVNPSGLFYARTGANYISGRTNSIAFHPTDSSTFYVGAAGGGVWKTTDGGLHFQPMTDNLSALTCGAVAVDPNNGSVVYVATGELNYSLDSYYGDGIFKSTDGGNAWTKIATTSLGSYFSALVINPQNSSIIHAAGSNGVFKSTDAGTTWANTNNASNVNSLVMDPTNPDVLYIASGGLGQNTISKTTDGGASWTILTNGLPPSGTARIALAISASNPSVLYASIANGINFALLGLYQTTNGGSLWTLRNSTTNYLGQQGWYDNAVTVSPTNPNLVIVGGLDIYSSTDGGITFTQKTVWYSTSSANFSHADIHFLGYNRSLFYCGSDGGVYKSSDNGTTWSDMNQTISTLQFQSADYDPTNTLRMYGGTQDNDKENTTNGGTLWVQRTTGDGGYTIVDPVNTNYIYGQYVNGSLHRSNDYGASYSEIRPSASPGVLFYNPYEMAPGDHNTIVFGRSDLWKTTSAQTATSSSGWSLIASTSTVSGSVSGIGISYSSTGKIYIGTNNGRILVTTNNGGTWTTTSGYQYVSDFAVDSTNDAVCYASFGGFVSAQHVYKTTNSGASWSNATGNLPNIPVNSIALRRTNPRTLFVGTDLGVYESADDGATWVSFNSGLPAVEVFDLKYKEPTGLLMAATHGRGCYTFAVSSPVQVTIQTCPSGHVFLVSGSTKTAPYALTFYPATTHQISTDSLQNQSPTTRMAYKGWSDGGSITHTISFPGKDSTITAMFKPQYMLTMGASPGTGGTVSPSSAYYDTGSGVSISASPAAGYSFGGWTGTGPGSYSGPNNPASVTMTGPVSETATFTAVQIPSQLSVRDNFDTTARTNLAGRFKWVNFTNNEAGSASLQINNDSTVSPFNTGGAGTFGGAAWDSLFADTTQLALVVKQKGGNGSNSTFFLYFRMTGKDLTTSSGYRLRYFDNPGGVDQINLMRVTNGTNGTTLVTLNREIAAGDTLLVKVEANKTMKALVYGKNGVRDSITAVDNTYNPSQWYCWLRGCVFGTPVKMDNFMIGKGGGAPSNPISVTVRTNSSGRSFTVDGVTYTTPQILTWASGSNHTIGTTSPQSGTTGTQYAWANWSDGGLITLSVSPAAKTTYTAYLTTRFFLTMGASPGTGGTVSPSSAYYDTGSGVSISASPAAGYSFGGWTGTGTGSYSGPNNPASVTMTGPVSETATFTAVQIPSQLSVRDNFDTTARTNLAGRFKWVNFTNNEAGSASLQINNDSTVSPFNTGGAGTFGGAAWDSLFADTTQLALVVKQKGGNGSNSTFFLYFRMTGKDLTTSSGYRLRYFDNPGGVDQINLMRVTNGTNGTTLVTLNREIAAGDTLLVKVEANKTMKALVYGKNGVRDSITAVDNTYNPSQWYCWLRGCVFGTPVKMDNFMIGKGGGAPSNPISVTVRTNSSGRSFTVDGVTYTTPQILTWASGSNHTIGTTSPQSGTTGTQYAWANWSDGGLITHSVSPAANTTYTANFTTRFFLTMGASPGTGGTVSPSSAYYDTGSGVSISASPAAGYSFGGWTGTGPGSYSGPNNPASVTMTGPVSETATFTAVQIPSQL